MECLCPKNCAESKSLMGCKKTIKLISQSSKRRPIGKINIYWE